MVAERQKQLTSVVAGIGMRRLELLEAQRDQEQGLVTNL